MIKPICPRCRCHLTRERSHRTLYYHCLKCLGMNVMLGALKKFIDSATLSKMWMEAQNSKIKSELPCSHCQTPMKTLIAPVEGGPELDVCLICHGIWLDHGEIDQLPPVVLEKKTQIPLEARRELAKIEIKKQEDLQKFHTTREVGENLGRQSVTESPGGYKTFLTIMGLPVEKHDDQFATQPTSTWALLGLCIFVSLLSFKHEAVFTALHFLPQSNLGMWFINGITSFFVHGGWFHLLGNMYFLWVFGDNVEDELGKTKYLLLVATASIAGAWAYGLFIPNKSMPLVGASGGISGILAYYLYRFPRRKFVIMFFFRWFSISAWLLVGLYFLKDIIGTHSQLKGHTHVSHITHLAGAAIGFCFAAMTTSLKKSRESSKPWLSRL